MAEASPRVMVVEDAPEYQGAVVLALLLEPEYKDLHLSSSGEEALEAFESLAPEWSLWNTTPQPYLTGRNRGCSLPTRLLTGRESKITKS